MATAQDLAKFVIKSFQEAEDPITNLKLQKILYYIQGWHLAMTGRPAFADRIEAWVHGPVQPGVYGQYKNYRWNPITEEVLVPSIDDELTSIIKEVLEAYGGDTGYELEIRTHNERPWVEARNGIPLDQESNSIITHDSMKQFFKELAQA